MATQAVPLLVEGLLYTSIHQVLHKFAGREIGYVHSNVTSRESYMRSVHDSLVETSSSPLLVHIASIHRALIV